MLRVVHTFLYIKLYIKMVISWVSGGNSDFLKMCLYLKYFSPGNVVWKKILDSKQHIPQKIV